jgi:uncharacterized membrane protein
MPIAFTNPWAWLLWPLLAAFFVWVARRSLADLSALRLRVALCLRLLILTLVVAALAGAQRVRRSDDLAVMFVLDFSDSVGPSAKAAAEKFIAQSIKSRRANDKWGVVVFGSEAFLDLTPGDNPSLGKIQTVPPTESTDISAAVRLALAALPDGARQRLVVLSDGNENLGDVLAEAAVAQSNGVAVDVVPLSPPAQREVLLETLTVPAEAKRGEPVDVRVVARSTVSAPATIKLFRDGKYLGSRQVELSPGRSAFTFPQSIERAGAVSFESQIEVARGLDAQPENNRALGFTIVRGQPKVLLVDNDARQSRFLSSALRRENVKVEVRPSSGMPRELREMQAFDAIVLGDVPAWEMTEKQMFSLQAYVRDLGCGLVMIGSESSFGPGGYRSTPVEEALPVTMDIKNQQCVPGGAIAMVMHSCEFEGGNDWAKSVCSQVTRQLGENDYAGLVVYGMQPNWVYPMLKVGDNRTRMLAEIRNINPGDMPDFDAALEVCLAGLKKVPAYLKHIIILSDGDPSPPRADLVNRINQAGITVSTVVIQPHDNTGDVSMAQIAKQHGGRFYKVSNPRQIPNIFLKEAATISRSAIIEETFVPRVGEANSVLKGISKLPPLLGYVGTSVKDSAQQVLVSKQDDPILATWQYGLGRGVAFTSDARQRWAAGWIGWPGFSKFWAQTVRWSMRQSTSGDLQTNVEIGRGQGRVSIEAVDKDGNLRNFLSPQARLVGPNFQGSDLALEQTGPGRYEASFDARALGTYLLNIRTRSGGQVASQVTGAVLPYSPEYSAVGANEPLLSRLADETNGQRLELDEAARVFTRPRTPVEFPRDIWLPLLALATLLFPLDVAARRVLWDETRLARRLRRPKRAASTSQPRPVASKTPGPAPTAPKPEAPTQVSPQRGPALDPIPAEAQAQQAPPQASEEDLDPMERLRRAKRRARGEE